MLEHWQSARAKAPQAKDPGTLLADYMVSLLVLSAHFKFKPVAGNTYHLYWAKGVWRLSLIAPQEWTDTTPGHFVGSCCLRSDMTWALDPAADLSDHPDLVQALDGFIHDFLETLEGHETLEAGLPFYVAQLPFYQRLLATGLASSLQRSARAGGMAQRKAHFWLGAADPKPLAALQGLDRTGSSHNR